MGQVGQLPRGNLSLTYCVGYDKLLLHEHY